MSSVYKRFRGETVQNANLIDAGRIGEVVSQIKADKLDKSAVKAYITATYVKNTSWYRVWSDGWIEQGGEAHISTPGQTVNLYLSMKDTNYAILANCYMSARFASCYNLTNSSFQVYTGDDGSFNASGIRWYVRGY